MSRLCLCVCVSVCASVWRCPLTPLTAAEQIGKDVRSMGALPCVTTGRKATGGETDVKYGTRPKREHLCIMCDHASYRMKEINGVQ